MHIEKNFLSVRNENYCRRFASSMLVASETSEESGSTASMGFMVLYSSRR